MFRLSAGGDMDLIVARKNRKNDWALKISLHIHCGDADVRQRSLKPLQFTSRASFINKENEYMHSFFLFSFQNKPEGKSYHQTTLTSLQICSDSLSPFHLYSQSCYSKLTNVIVTYITCKGSACFAVPTLLRIWPSPNFRANLKYFRAILATNTRWLHTNTFLN